MDSRSESLEGNNVAVDGVNQSAPHNEPKNSLESIEKTMFKLIGNNISCLPLEMLKKRSVNEKTEKSFNSKARWRLTPFENPARNDGLKLKHWVNIGGENEEGYRFSKYNTTSTIYNYSTEEYYNFLRDDDWTKEETDYLFSLIESYDLRFPVIHDRYDFLGGNRSIDDLKSRYYSICQKLITNRPSHQPQHQHDESSRKNLLHSYNFDKQKEFDRKNHLKKLFDRTADQVAQEEFLYVEARRLEQNSLKRCRNREELMRLIGGAQYQIFNELKSWPTNEPQSLKITNNSPAFSKSATTSTPSTATHNIHNNQTLVSRPAHQPKKKSGRRSENFDESIAENFQNSQPDSTGIDREVQLVEDVKNCVYRFDQSSSAAQYRTVALRSTRITLPKTVAASTRINGVMNDLKIPITATLPKPLVMPTRKNVEVYEALIQAANQLAELKRQVERVEGELKIQKKKKETLLGSSFCNSEKVDQTEIIKEEKPLQSNSNVYPKSTVQSSSNQSSKERNNKKKRSASVSSSDSSKGETDRKKIRHV